MRFILLLLLLLSVSFYGNAQGDFGGKSVKIAPTKKTKKTEVKEVPVTRFQSINFPAITPPSSSFNSPTPTTTKQIGETSKITMTSNQDFKNPGDVYMDNLNKKKEEGIYKAFRQNQNLGDFKTKSKYVRIRCRDYGEIDGDEVNILVNGILVNSYVLLTGDYKEFEIGLINGFNKIDFLALNQGLLGPNTAEFEIFDDQGVLISSNLWNLATGFKGTVIMVKE